jgi:thymidylate kinase
MKFGRSQIAVVITGPDGSGKSTACSAVSESLKTEFNSVAVCSIWDALAGQSVFSSKQGVGEYLTTLSGEARTLFLCHAMLQSLELALKKNTELVLIDGYFYKYVVSELAYGVPMDIIRGATLAFPKPRCTFYLNVTPEEAWKRKTRGSSGTSAYERGKGSDTEEAFLHFQNQMHAKWSEVQAAWGPWKELVNQDPPSVAQAIETECLRLRGARG